MTVYCRSDDCKWFEEGCCTANFISISEYNECEDYESYLDTEEWQKPFWKRLKDSETQKIYRVRFYGKEIDVNGRKFFVETKSYYALATDAITGYGACKQGDLEERFEKIMQAVEKLDIPPLESLPEGLFVEGTRRIFPKEGEQK